MRVQSNVGEPAARVERASGAVDCGSRAKPLRCRENRPKPARSSDWPDWAGVGRIAFFHDIAVTIATNS
jgi:hypothetical protein